ncbi:hypothetical protein BDN70DRAFT_888602 [Pholiota conissans]|uniref:NACHT domain-containing protein n=1 Tax=Pholiota conissans TaxID=109636 RepID=A0A9P5YJF9_9AGAR|nr:hypothetical protein BDN70DRAFT_888602 [Pholiota conissans]
MLFSKSKKLFKEAKKKFSRQARVHESLPGPSLLEGEDRGEESSLVQSGIGSLVPSVDSVADTSQGKLSTLQPSYPGSSSSAQTHDHQGNTTLTRPPETHSTGNVVDPSKTQAIPDNATGHPQSTIKGIAGAAWSFTETLLKKLPDAVDTNPAKAVLGAIRIVLQIKDDVRGNINSVDEQIRTTATQLDDVEKALGRWKYKDNNSQETQALSRYQMTLNEECKKLIKLKKQSLPEQIAIHEENKGKIAEIFQRINQAKEQLVRETGLRVQEIVVEIREDVVKLQKLLLAQLKPSDLADYKFEPEDEDQQALRRVECTPGTRVRILKDITRWANDTSSNSQNVYWLTGQAGSGKSTLAYTIARRFEAALDADDNIVLGGNFFCSRQMKETRSATYIVRTIVYHLAHKWTAFAEALNRRNFDVINHSVRSQIQTLLIEPWEEAQQAEPSNLLQFLVVIDALDEITGKGGSEFLHDLFDAINKSRLRGLKFFATSRPDQGLVDHVESFPNKQFYHLAEVPMEEAEADIATYLNAELPIFKDTQVMKKLVEQAAGLFIYAATVVKYLENFLPSEQRERIDELPPSGVPQSQTEAPMLDNLYLQILRDAFCQFKGISFNRRLSILHTILCSGEPISTNVIAELLFPPSKVNFRDIVGPVLKGLHAVLYIKNDTVLSYHKSFIDFMFDQNRATKEFWCDPLDSRLHLHLATSCFYNMDSLKFNIADIESSFTMDHNNSLLSDAAKQNIQPILRYSCRNWEHHIVKTDSKELANTLLKFLELPVLFWIEAMNLMNSRSMCERMLRNTHNWITNENPSLGEDLSEAASFALHFSGSGAALSTPHLYISALATWRPNSGFSWGWRNHFTGIPKFVHSFGGRTLMTIAVQSQVHAIACSSDNKHIVSGLGDETVRVWDASTGVELKKLEGHSHWVESVAFSSDNKHIVSGSGDKTVRVWDASTGVELKKLEGHSHWVESVAFSSDNKHIVSGSADLTVRVWDASTGVELKKLEGHSDFVQSVGPAFPGSGDRTGQMSALPPQHPFNCYLRQKIDQHHTGWLLSPEDAECYLMFVPLSANLPDSSNILTIPQSAAASVDFTSSTLGCEWTKCYCPK